MGEREFAQWKHNPLTKAFFEHLDDRYASARDTAADLVEGRGLQAGVPEELRNLDVVRGGIVMLRELKGIALRDIHGFYGKETPVSQDDQSDADPRGSPGY